MKKFVRQFMFMAVFIACLTLGIGQVQAAGKTVTVTNESSTNVELVVGDTGQIVPSVPSAGNSMTGNYYDNDIDDDYDEYWEEPEDTPVRYTYTLDEDYCWYEDEHSITIDDNGNFTAVQAGTDCVIVKGYSAGDYVVFEAEVYFKVSLDMSMVSLEKTQIKAYLFAYPYQDGNQVEYQSANVEIPIKSPVVLDEYTQGLNLSIKSSNSNVNVYGYVSENKLYLTLSAQKKCSTTITITMGGKEFKVKVTLQPVEGFVNSYLLEKGKTKKLTVKGYSGKIYWSSTNPKVASVSSSGVVKGKTIGNAVITAKIGDQRIGCAVSVTTAALKKVCARGTYIGTHWTYSQPKRAQNGYYDCSALVWKAYQPYSKINFGTSYPGSTKSEAPWCRDHGKLMKGGFSYKKMQKMQLNPGDIVFKSSDLKNPYTTLYHVEMFTGYACTGYDSNGKPIVVDKWAAREDGYGWGFEEGSLWARPTK